MRKVYPLTPNLHQATGGDMKTIGVRQFIREFRRHRDEVCLVEQNGKLLGIWTPAEDTPPSVDFAARLKKHFKKPLPFTGAELLKQERLRIRVHPRSSVAR